MSLEKPPGFEEHVNGLPILHGQKGGYSFGGITVMMTMPRDTLEAIPNMELYKDDVIVAGFPKTGGGWLQEITYLVLNDANTEAANATPSFQRIPFIETLSKENLLGLKNAQRPKILKTHLPMRMIPDHSKVGAKLIYSTRNPKDVAVSFYHFHRMNMTMHAGDFDEFLELFMSDDIAYGNYLKHVADYTKAAEQADSNVLIIKYEDNHKDPEGTIKKIAEFCNKTLTQTQIDEILDHTTFKNMSNNPSTNYEGAWFFDQTISKYLRKGIVGDWKESFTSEQTEKFDKWLRDVSESTGVTFG
ncbi:unnamed protein product [Owenia fusiformis]|uniref:Uncharacterized protein n=1 Tax=Owenia fusiformis TaxID=6347 RepID=A0A8J1TG75_OWEFU|nr:unnamed protein product [Owenia fusiformis]